MTRCFCMHCNEVVEPVIVEYVRDITFQGELFKDVTELQAECPTCHEGFLIKESHDVNLRNLHNMLAERLKGV